MNLDELFELWDNLHDAIQRVEVSQPSSMTVNVNDMHQARLVFGRALTLFSKTPAGRAALREQEGE